MRMLLREFRYGVRILRAKPAFALVVVVTLALGIGANSAVFSIIDAVLLRPLPYSQPARLVVPWGQAPQLGFDQLPLSYLNYLDWKAQSSGVFSGFGVFAPHNMNLTATEEPELVPTTQVSVDLFSVLGVGPVIGRNFRPDEGQLGNDRVVILSHGFWQRRFGARPEMLGSKLTLDGQSYLVVGIMPGGFTFPPSFTAVGNRLSSSDLWVPLALDPAKEDRGHHHLFPIARLKPGVSLAQAQAEITTIAKRLERQYPDSNNRFGAKVVPLTQQVQGEVRLPLLILLGSVSFVLLIACANVANLMLTRALSREREFAVRSALGANRVQMIGHLVGESLPLALLGGGLGLLLAQVGIKLLIAFSPGDIPRIEEAAIDGRVLTFTLAVSLLTGVLFSLLPAMRMSRTDLVSSLKEGLRSSSNLRSGRVRQALGIAEVALALMLVVGSGLMLKSLVRLLHVDPGFNPQRVLAVELTLPRTKYPTEVQAKALYQRAIERIRALPGVQSAGGVSYLPLAGADASTGFFVQGKPAQPGETRQLHYRAVIPGYFRTLGIPLVAGRDFTDADQSQTPQVVIINESLASRYWPNESPLGKRLAIDFEVDNHDGNLAAAWRQVVGVVKDVKHAGLDSGAKPESFSPYVQMPTAEMTLVLRAAADPRQQIGPVRQVIHEIDPDLPVGRIAPMEEMLSGSVSRPRFQVLLLSLFAGLAMVLAAVGIYGVMSHLVAQRRHEIGVRMALGARRGHVVTAVAHQAVWLVAVGVGLGLGGSLVLSKVLHGLLFEVSTTDAPTLVAAPVLVVLVAVVACFVPTYKALRVDPTVALREE
jgi:putative ABC transport system permease protein